MSSAVAFLAQAALVCGPAAQASFAEGAPVDRFEIANISAGPWAVDRAEIALEGSSGRLVFDTARGGPGRNVPQPFRALEGAARLAERPDVPDGAETLALAFALFPPGARFAFTIDMDDRISGAGGTTVADQEITGATLTVTFRHADGGTATYSGAFDAEALAVAAAPCVS